MGATPPSLTAPPTKPFVEGPFSGEIAAPFAERVAEIPALLASEAYANSRILKEGRARTICVVDSPFGLLCVKEFRSAKPSDKFLLRIRGSRAYLEWVRLNRLAHAGVPVASPFFWVEEKPSSDGPIRSWVAMEYLEGCRTLSETLADRSQLAPRRKRDIAIAAGKALARMHQAGGRHDDLHAGNILVRNVVDTRPEVFLVDLHQVALKRRLSWNDRLRNLGRLLGGLRPDLPTSLEHRAMRAYLETLADWDPPFSEEREARRSMGAAVKKYARADFARRWRRRAKKCEEHGKRFHRVRTGRYMGWIRADRDFPDLLENLAAPNAWIDSTEGRILKHTPTTTVARVQIPDTETAFFIKRYNRKGVWERLKNLFRPSRSIKVWRTGYALELLDIPTPKTVCALERKIGPLVLESFIVTDWIEGGVGFDDAYRERAAVDSDDPFTAKERKDLELTIARLFRDLHAQRISHGDLKGRNVLLDPAAPCPYNPTFVDLDALSLRPIRFRRSRINDLSRLLFSVYPVPSLLRQVRFFREYAKGNPELWKERRTWFVAIRKRTERKLREKGIP